MFTTRRWAIVLLLGAGLAVRLLIAPHGGHPYDLVVIGGWAADVAQTGYLNAYANTPANYGPLMVALMGLTARLYLWLGGASFETSGLWPVVFKLPSIVCDLGIGWLVYRLASDREIDVVGAGLKRCGRTRSVRASSPAPTTGRPVLLAGLVIFHPALILLSAWWGQYEQPYTLPLLVSAALLARADNRLDRLIASGVALGLGVMVKPTALASLPALSLMALHGGWQARNPHPLRPKVVALTPCKGEGESARAPMGGGLARSALLWALGVAAACLFWLAPFIVTGQAGLVWGRITAPMIGPAWLTINAHNFWFLATGGAGNLALAAPLTFPDSQVVVIGLRARTVGVLLLVIWTAAVLGLAWRAAAPPADSPSPIAMGEGRGGGRPSPLQGVRVTTFGRKGWGFPAASPTWFLACALLHLGMFLWLTRVTERYAFGALIFGAAWAATSTRVGWRRWLFFAMISVLHTVNLLWSVPYLVSVPVPPLWIGPVNSVGMLAAGVVGLVELARAGRLPLQSAERGVVSAPIQQD